MTPVAKCSCATLTSPLSQRFPICRIAGRTTPSATVSRVSRERASSRTALAPASSKASRATRSASALAVSGSPSVEPSPAASAAGAEDTVRRAASAAETPASIRAVIARTRASSALP